MPRTFNSQDLTTIKVTSANLILLSKVIADIRLRYRVFSQSSILVNSETQAYFVYLNVKNSEIAERLQEVSPYPAGAQQL